MPAIAAWKILVPAAGIALVAFVTVRTGDFPLSRELPKPTPAAANRHSELGYLVAQELPDSVALLPPPPQAGSAAMKRDEEDRGAALRLHGSPRYALAASDANRDQEATVSAFQCAFGTEISAERTPTLYKLLAKVRLDVRATSYVAKSHFHRPRPFATYNTHTCSPPDEQNVRNDGSYPSARGAVGWSYALVLSDLNPDRAEQIMQRGRDFLQSRIVCDEEWQSDLDAGRTIAEATLQPIYRKPDFRSDLSKARTETAAPLRSSKAPPSCQAERLALASR
jgi:acid phosphatase (class A)